MFSEQYRLLSSSLCKCLVISNKMVDMYWQKSVVSSDIHLYMCVYVCVCVCMYIAKFN